MVRSTIIPPPSGDFPPTHIAVPSSSDDSSSSEEDDDFTNDSSSSSSVSDVSFLPTHNNNNNRHGRSGPGLDQEKEEEEEPSTVVMSEDDDDDDEFDVEEPPIDPRNGKSGTTAPSCGHSCLSFLNTPLCLIGAGLIFFIVALVVGLASWQDSNANNGTGSSRVPPALSAGDSIAPVFDTLPPAESPIVTIATSPEQATTTVVDTPEVGSTTPGTSATQGADTTTEATDLFVEDTTPEEQQSVESTPQISTSDATTEAVEERPPDEEPVEVEPTPDNNKPPEKVHVWTAHVKITLDDDDPGTGFGAAVALDNNTLVATSDKGVYFFVQDADDWVRQGPIVPTETQGNSAFGSCIAISGDTAIVGDSNYDVGNDRSGWDAGRVYVYNRDEEGTWKQVGTIEAEDGQQDDEFGASCAISGHRMVIGAPLVDNGDGSDVGAAFAYALKEGEWTLDRVLSPPQDSACSGDSLSGYKFGSMVALDGDRIAVSPSPEQNCRRVHIFDHDGGMWPHEDEVGGDGGCSYSISLSNEGDALAIGDPCGGHNEGGRVLVYTRGDKDWGLEAQISARESKEGDKFGAGVALDDNKLLIGRSGNGSAEFYYRAEDGWDASEETVLQGGGGAGDQVALSGSFAVIGEQFDDDAGENAGAVYVFRDIGSINTTEDDTTDEVLEGLDGVDADGPANAVVWAETTSLAGELFDVDGEAMITTRESTVSIYRKDEAGNWNIEADITPESFKGGSCVAISGGRAVVGAYEDGDDGVAYLFEYESGTWREKSRLTPSTEGGQYGWSCDISGNRLVVGAPGNNSAHAYAEKQGVWRLDKVLTPAEDSACAEDSMEDYRFGSAVVVAGDRIVVGPAPQMNGSCRRVHIFDRNQGVWPQVDEIGEDGDCPYSVSLGDEGNSLALGDPCALEDDRGLVMVYGRDEDEVWKREAIITARNSRGEDQFGADVALDGDNLLIGRPRNGGAEVYVRGDNGWSDTEQASLEGGILSGAYIALSGETAVVGVGSYDDGSNGFVVFSSYISEGVESALFRGST